MNHIILIGFMGAGKTTLGRKLARKEHLEFVDTDDLVEEINGKSIPDIFEEQGEAAFRRMETEALRTLQKKERRCVIAVGGGLPVQPANPPILRKLGKVVYLEASIDTLAERLGDDQKRPKLQGGNIREKIESLMRERKALYEQVADVRISTDHRGFQQILQEIMEKVG